MANILAEYDFSDSSGPLATLRGKGRLSMNEVLCALGYGVKNLLDGQDVPDGLEPASALDIRTASLCLTTAGPVVRGVPKVTDTPLNGEYWLEVRYIDKKRRHVAVFPNDASPQKRLMLYSIGPKLDGVETAQIVAVDLLESGNPLRLTSRAGKVVPHCRLTRWLRRCVCDCDRRDCKKGRGGADYGGMVIRCVRTG